MPRIAIALGSNLGDRRQHLETAIDLLMPHLRQALVSSFLDTEPEGVTDDQPRYLNAALVGEAQLLPQALLKRLLSIEEALQRVESGSYGVCRDCGDEIARVRLEAIPWTRVCISCKETQKA